MGNIKQGEKGKWVKGEMENKINGEWDQSFLGLPFRRFPFSPFRPSYLNDSFFFQLCEICRGESRKMRINLFVVVTNSNRSAPDLAWCE